MTESERIKLLRDAPKLVKYGISKGWITPNGKRPLGRKRGLPTAFLAKLSEAQIQVVEEHEPSRPKVEQFNQNMEGAAEFRKAFKRWEYERQKAILSAGGDK